MTETNNNEMTETNNNEMTETNSNDRTNKEIYGTDQFDHQVQRPRAKDTVEELKRQHHDQKLRELKNRLYLYSQLYSTLRGALAGPLWGDKFDCTNKPC